MKREPLLAVCVAILATGISARNTQRKHLHLCLQLLTGLSVLLNLGYAAAQTPDSQMARTGNTGQPPYNIVFIIVDQMTYRLLAGPDYSLPALDAIASHGVRFQNHFIFSAMCSPSRATFLTGRPPQFHHVIDQMQYSFVPTLDPNIPNVGSVLKGLGYKTAYFGKFEMDKGILSPKPTVNYSLAAQPYGFDVFSAGGDIGSAPRSGFENDPLIAGESVRWLRVTATEARRTRQPFFMVASFVNPHDIMFGDGNVPGQAQVQKAVVPQAMPPPPPDSIYEKKWSFTLPASLPESLTAPGMPSALLEYQKGWDGWSGTIPTDRKDMWTIFYDYYLNTIQDSERSVRQIVDVLNEMDLWRDTVVVFTADHGEMGGPRRPEGQGAHELRGKRPRTADYREPLRQGRHHLLRNHQPSRPGSYLRRPDRATRHQTAGRGEGTPRP